MNKPQVMRRLEEHDKARVAQLAGFRAEIGRRVASLDQGEGVDGKEFFGQLECEEGTLLRKGKAK
ncbi:MAG: hypothetical protein M3O35_21495 [Acidobacteriota bacterium]|nr:hypothetical protein [Acidobacteriota bacterium]